MSILVIGSFMMDFVARTSRVPKRGETVIGNHFARYPGGKGANQAVAAARLGGDVTMVGTVGNDSFGNEMIAILEQEGICTKYISKSKTAATGAGLITIDENGDNQIIVVPGANLEFSPKNIKTLEELIRAADLLILQLEINISTVETCVEYAKSAQVPILLNPAPAQSLSIDLLKKITLLTPNETEAELLTGISTEDITGAEMAVARLLDQGVSQVVMTLGEKGVIIGNRSEIRHLSGYGVQSVDTVAAGDAFNGALAVALIHGKSLEAAVQFAQAAGALATTKSGAIPSLPTLEAVSSFLDLQ
ncbi:ribokinase [Seinonella peptonophila]|uniref:Deoxyribokinase n=1 Tax=Seinonella peptonophila TaxID=112248 RepID=A0A1M4T415_9BACL|nr:ribokinase [Seinonella peptonophila]SHE39171.1 ribokinase [Seinonella peptonophila]